MRRTAVALGLVAVLLLSLYGLALAQTPPSDQYATTATFDVPEVIDIDVVDAGVTGLTFPNAVLGNFTAEASQGASTPAVRLTVNAATNVPCSIVISATQFTAEGVTSPLPATILYYDTSNSASSRVQVTTSEAATPYTTLSSNNSADFWHWLGLPSTAAPGTYTGTVTYKAVKG